MKYDSARDMWYAEVEVEGRKIRRPTYYHTEEAAARGHDKWVVHRRECIVLYRMPPSAASSPPVGMCVGLLSGGWLTVAEAPLMPRRDRTAREYGLRGVFNFVGAKGFDGR